ncbi:non-ribosomal peptide synthetase [Streptomyces sp. ICBB 8177]|uniref:non-ribosomal peptide synthetase n=1 Tax=Streptomyces sp. ICBB 8177 TaxID=563922 RepID=UPI000D6806B9|nr:non-ribosomal peptide synthetase [Streptomyces sp. ICBB 8177]AOC89000.1 putative nonribosomal peptide synthetase [Streptomyces sp. ICBB 8177]PWI41637.1 adenylation domain-containing protein [Streptomyces sp. ICBB 8177]
MSADEALEPLESLPTLFERTVSRHGGRTALVAEAPPQGAPLAREGASLTYARLNSLANQAARELRRSHGIEWGTAVGLHLDRSPELYVVMLAVLKAGGHVVPLNPAHPHRMIDHIVTEARVRLVVHHGGAAGHPGTDAVTAGELLQRASQLEDHDLEPVTGPEDTAFVLYTSGSTGRPKGTRIAHRGLARLVLPVPGLALTEGDCLLQQAAPSFAASMNEVWLAFLAGAKLAVLPPGLPSLSGVRQIIEEHGVTVLSLPCGLFNLLVDNELDALAKLRAVFVSGDFPSPRHLRRAARETSVRIFNGYGCTENSAISALFPVDADALTDSDPVPVGRPLPLVGMAVVDERLTACPPGQPGELVISGAGLALGYVDAALGEGRFVTSPRTGARLYRTGDRAYVTADGDIVVTGRGDGQVKVRGYRVETGAVELALRAVEPIDQAVVKPFRDSDGEARLVAFCTTRDGEALDAVAVSTALMAELPDYMVPSTYQHLDRMPTTVNGKTDRSALTEPDDVQERKRANPMANPLEGVVLQVWRDIIGDPEVAVDDPFLGHGGNSLHFVQLASTLEKVLAVKVTAEEIFRNGDVRKLAAHIEDKRASGLPR